jgi:hypothetical protein
MIVETTFLAVRSINGATPDIFLLHHFDVSCTKCLATYGVWGPAPESEKRLRQEQESWLTKHLPDVCPYHRDSFPIPDAKFGLSLHHILP